MISYLSDRLAIDRLKREYQEHGKLIIGFDFDCTIYDYHNEGLELQPVISLLKKCSDLGFVMCLYSLILQPKERSENDLGITQKINHCNDLGIKVDYFNNSPVLTNQIFNNTCYKKPYFNILLDDRAGLSASYNILKTTLEELNL